MSIGKFLPLLQHKRLAQNNDHFAVSILGAGQWGTVLAWLAAKAGHPVVLYDHNPTRAKATQAQRQNPALNLGLQLPPNVLVTADLGELTQNMPFYVFAVPSSAVLKTCIALKPHMKTPRGIQIVHGVKGLLPGKKKRISQVLKEQFKTSKIGVLSGPNLALEIANGHPTACVIASRSSAIIQKTQSAFASNQFRVYGSKDVIGVEYCGTFKNILALAAGAIHEMKFGQNTTAMVLTRGLAELGKLIHSLGGKKETLLGLAGIGDIIATSTSPLSRNFRAGGLLAQGKTEKEIHETIQQTVEGLSSVALALELAKLKRVELPITKAIHSAIKNEQTLIQAFQKLLERPLGPEF